LSPVDVNEIINRTLDLVQTHETEKKVTVITRLAQDLPPVYVDTGELQQIYTNIAINAFQAMKQKGGKLIVETSQDDAGYVVAKFADTGPGISPENLSKIFDPFFTTKPEMEGTGLGLSVCRGLVEKYNGKIEVETRVGHGATFIVKLPAVEESSLDLPDAA
jgi:two-component system NtrC family sensor kinase